MVEGQEADANVRNSEWAAARDPGAALRNRLDLVGCLEWRAREDDSRTFLDDFVAALPQVEFPAGVSL